MHEPVCARVGERAPHKHTRTHAQTHTHAPDAAGTLEWVQGDAEQLPFDDASFDSYTIAFGIRNCTHLDKVVREAYRVLKPGGRFMCMEFSQPTSEIFNK